MGLKQHNSDKLLAKEWMIQSSSEELLAQLKPYICPGNHEHGESIGANRLWRTAIYPPLMVTAIAEALLTK